jgi:alpha-L-fucosidase
VAPNLSPNRQGLIQPEYVAWLKQLGQTWTPSATRPDLPAQGPHMDWVITPVNATATSNSSTARLVMDGVSDGGFAASYEQYVWTSSGSLPQSVTIDLGALYYNVEMCTYLPQQIARDETPKDSSQVVTGYKIYYSADGSAFNQVTLTDGANGTWPGDITLKYALFNPVTARYMRLEITSVRSGSVAIISELDFGGYTRRPSTTATVIANRIDFMPTRAECNTPARCNAFVNVTNDRFGGMSANAGPVTYFSLDGKKLYRQGNLPVLPAAFASKTYVARTDR